VRERSTDLPEVAGATLCRDVASGRIDWAGR
jgi:hypothetical protein